MKCQELKGKRVAAGMKQSDVAKALDTTEKTISIKENAKECKFSVQEIKKLSKLYNLNILDVNDIFFDDELPNGN
jgi:DNA-binding helix-turn-helix protein